MRWEVRVLLAVYNISSLVRAFRRRSSSSSSSLAFPSRFQRSASSRLISMTTEEQAKQERKPVGLVNSFEARDFQPPFWGRNEHFQTIWGARALQGAFIKLVRPSKAITWVDVYDRRERWTTKDGDFFHVDYLYSDEKLSSSSSSASDKPNKPIAIVLHGLESTSSALLPRSMAKAFAQRGLDVAALNFRGCCGGEDNLKPYSYHLGFTDDIKFAIKKLHAENPGRHIYLSGFSLGANVILKALGELGEEAISLHVKGAAVSNVPFDANLSSGKLDSGFNRAVYVSNFLTTLKTKAKRKWDMDPESDMYDIQRVLSCSKIGDFDDEVIAKLHGFEGKVDYYKKSDSKQYLPFIRVPTLVINAIDDPFINELGLPQQEDLGPDVPVRLVYHEHGGHCGFITGKEGPREEDQWLPTELARFFDHLENPYGRKGEPSRRGIGGGGAGQESGSSSSLPPALA